MPSYTPQEFAVAVLRKLGAPTSSQNLKALDGWIGAEGGDFHNDARFNPLNTTEDEPGAGNTGSQGNIKVYKSLGQGVDATVKTLTNGRYGGIISALKKGTSAAAVADAIGQSPWGTNAALVRKAITGAATPAAVAGGAQTTAPAASAGSTQQQVVQQDDSASPDLGSSSTIAQQIAAALSAGQPQGPTIGALQAPSFAAQAPTPAGYTPLEVTQQDTSQTPSLSDLLAAVSGSVDTSAPASSDSSSSPAQATTEPAASTAATPAAAGAKRGTVRVAPGANAPGKSLTPGITKLLSELAGTTGKAVTVGTGTNHSYLTVDGNVSDHATGNAADLPATGAALTKQTAQALLTFGSGQTVQWERNDGSTTNVKITPATAAKIAAEGGLWNIPYGQHRRIQVIGNSHIGGDHTTHTHVGVTGLR